MTRSNFPYAQIAAAQAQRSAAILLSEKPKLLEEQPYLGSPILLATTALCERLVHLHRDPKQLHSLNRRLFEELVAELFDGFGYSVELTAQTRDGGRDVIAIGNKDLVRTKFLIECKRPEPGTAIGVGFVRQLLGVVEDERATKGILVATTYFSPDAKAFQERNEWRLDLQDYDQIVDWISRYVQLKG
ncbi:MAG: restriction endonuclease [Nitrososphaera sp.]|nr:restriction endonuclease [Nitrososphaera sp.]